MNKNSIFRISTNAAMIILFVFLFSPKGTGILGHEVFGIILFVLFAMHNIVNRRWYGGLFAGKYNIMRLAWTFLNIALCVMFLTLIISGIMISRHLFDFLDLGGGLTAHKIHVFAANWSLVLAALHLGFHWDRLKAALGAMARIWRLVLSIFFAALAVYGLAVCFELDIWSKLFLQATFSAKRGGSSLFAAAGNYFAAVCFFAALGALTKSVLARGRKNV